MFDLCSLDVSDGLVLKIADTVSGELLGGRFLGELFDVGIPNIGIENSSGVIGLLNLELEVLHCCSFTNCLTSG